MLSPFNLLLSFIFVSCIIPTFHDLLDNLVEYLWSAIYNFEPFHWAIAEALTAAFGFWWSASFFETLHLLFPSVLKHRIQIDGVCYPSYSRPQVLRSPLFFIQTKVAGTVVYLSAIFIFHALVRSKPSLPADAPSFFRFISEVSLGIFLYDLCFTPIHWLMHNGSPFLHRIHRVHHEDHGALSAGATVRHSIADGALQVCVNITVQFATPWNFKHPLSRLAHNLVVTYLLSEAHSGYDLPWMSHRLFPEIFGGAIRHNAHHNKGNVYYQQFLKYLDDAMGSIEKIPSAKSLSQ